MVQQFWETVAGELAKRWAALAATAASVFWASGVVAWGLGHSHGFRRIDHFFAGLDTFTQVALAAGALALVFGSAYVMDLFTPIVLRLLQGDVQADRSIPTYLRERVRTRRETWRKELRELEEEGFDTLSPAKSRRAAELDRKLHNVPVHIPDLRSTRLGNLMSASEARPLRRYGLNPDVVWPAMWLVLPDVTRSALQTARASVDGTLRALVWGALLIVWIVWTPWVLIEAAAVVVVAYPTLLRRAEAFGEISEAVFALYRFDLYAKLRFPPPATPDEDRDTGERVTDFLWRGSTRDNLRWQHGGHGNDAEGSDPSATGKTQAEADPV